MANPFDQFDSAPRQLVPGTGPKAPSGYAAPGAPAIAFQRGGPDDPDVIARNARIAAGIAAAKEKEVATYRAGLDLGADATKRARDRDKPFTGEGVSSLRKELDSQPAVKSYKGAISSYASAMQAADSPAGDLNVIYAYAKILDPDSVVREGEQAAVAGLGTIGEQIAGSVRKQLGGDGRLAPELRRSLIGEMRTRVSDYDKGYNAERARFRELSNAQGVDPALVVGPHIGDAYAKVENKYWRGDPNLDAQTYERRRIEGLVASPNASAGGGASTSGPGGGNNGGPWGFDLATGDTRQVPDYQASAIIDAGIRGGLTDEQINATLKAIDFNSRVDPKQTAAARAQFAANPGYAGSFGGATRTVPTTVAERAVSSPVGLNFGDALTGGNIDSMSSNPGAVRNALSDYRENNFWSSLAGGAAGAATATAGLQFGLGKLAPRVGGALGEALASPITADTLYGAAYGAGTNDENRYLGAILGGTGGWVGGAAGRGLGTLGTAGVNRMFGRTAPRALNSGEQNVLGAAQRQGIPAIESQLSEAASLGIPMSLADTGANLGSLSGAAIRRSPTAAGIARDTFGPRSRGQYDRFLGAIERDLGPVNNIPQLSNQLIADASNAARPKYLEAYAQPAVGSPRIDELVGTPFGREGLGFAGRIAGNERRGTMVEGFRLGDDGNVVLNPANADLHGNLALAQSAFDDAAAEVDRIRRISQGGSGGTRLPAAQERLANATADLDSAKASLQAQPTPGMAATSPVYSPRTLDTVVQGLDQGLEKYRNQMTGRLDLGPVGRSDEAVRRELMDEIRTLNPTLGEARSIYAGPAAERDALLMGQNAVNLSPDQLAFNLGRSSDSQKAQMRLGFQSQLGENAGRVRYSTNPFESVLGTPAMEQRIGALYTGAGANPSRLLKQRDIERKLAESTNSLIGNSLTEERRVADEGFAGGNLLPIAADVVTGAAGGVPLASVAKAAGSRGLRDALTFGVGKRAAKKAEQIAPLVFDADPNAALRSLSGLASNDDTYRAYLNSLRSRRYGGMFGASVGATLPLAFANR